MNVSRYVPLNKGRVLSQRVSLETTIGAGIEMYQSCLKKQSYGKASVDSRIKLFQIDLKCWTRFQKDLK